MGPEPAAAVKPTVNDDDDAVHAASTVVAPAAAPVAPRHHGVAGCSDAISVPLTPQNSFCLDPAPHGHAQICAPLPVAKLLMSRQCPSPRFGVGWGWLRWSGT